MFERVDGARATSYVILLVAVALVGGVVFEYAAIAPDAARIGSVVAGSLFVAYAVCATGYLLVREHASGE